MVPSGPTTCSGTAALSKKSPKSAAPARVDSMRLPRERGENRLQRGDVGGLHQVLVEARGLGLAPVALLSPAGEGDDHRRAPLLARAHVPRGFVAVHARHAEVEEHHRRAELAELLER